MYKVVHGTRTSLVQDTQSRVQYRGYDVGSAGVNDSGLLSFTLDSYMLCVKGEGEKEEKKTKTKAQ